MRGKFVNGNVQFEGTPYPDGTTVVIWPADGDEAIEITDPDLEAELTAAMDEADRGEVIPAARLMQELKEIRERYQRGTD
jgi:hypothetical protein